MIVSTSAQDEFSRQRKAGLAYIGLGGIVAVGLWLALMRFLPPVTGMTDPAARMLFTLKCFCCAVLFCLVAGVEAVAHERLLSPAFDPLTGFETRRLKVNQRYLQNTLEQTVVFAAALFGLAAYSQNGSGMRAVVAATVIWTLSRFAFWLGYHRSAAARGLGAPGMALSLVLLIYIVARFGGEIAGTAGACASVGGFLALEAVLVRAVRRPSPQPQEK